MSNVIRLERRENAPILNPRRHMVRVFCPECAEDYGFNLDALRAAYDVVHTPEGCGHIHVSLEPMTGPEGLK